MSFLSRIEAALKQSYWFGKDSIPSALKSTLKNGKENVTLGYGDRNENISKITKDPSKIKGMLLYSFGDYFSAPKKYFVFYMDNKTMIWDRDTQSNWSSWTGRSIEATPFFMDWHKKLRFYPKAITYKEYQEIKNIQKFIYPEKEISETEEVSEIKSEFAKVGLKVIKVSSDSNKTYFEFAPTQKRGRPPVFLRVSYENDRGEYIFRPEERSNPNDDFDEYYLHASDNNLSEAVQKCKKMLSKFSDSI